MLQHPYCIFLHRKIVEGGLINLLGDIGWGLKQVPPLVLDSLDTTNCVSLAQGLKAKNCAQVGVGCKEIRDHVAAHCKDHTFPLILGGDHCISIGTVSAIKTARKDAGIVWVGLLNLPYTVPVIMYLPR